jgi:hypothetical protein
MFGYNIGTFKGLEVSFYISECSRSTSGYIDPAPINPKPPALLTALASLCPTQIIPAWMIDILY